MGNSLCGKAPIEKEISERKSIKIQIIKNPKIQNNDLFGNSKENSLILRKSNSGEKEKIQKIILSNFDENELSFLDKKEDKEKNNETFSFVLYGEDVSKVRQTFLAELNNMKDLTLKISKNHLLLMTEDNQELLNLLKKKNINPNNLFGNDNNLTNTILEQETIKIIKNKNKEDENELPNFIKNQYNRMIQKSLLNNNEQDSSKFLNTFILEEEDFGIEVDSFLEKQNILNEDKFRIDLWDSKKHEIEQRISNNENSSFVEKKLIKLALEINLKFDKNYKNINKTNIIQDIDYNLENFKKKTFQSDLIYSSILGLIQYDLIFGTRLLTRIIYPQKNGIPIASDNGLYIVKLNVNGCKRAVVIQDIDNNDNLEIQERFPFIIEKALFELYLEKSKLNIFKDKKISNLIFRLCNWIPETLNVFDIGDSLTSFSKLEENFNKGYLILFYKDSVLKKIKPILNLIIDKKNYKRFIKTTSESESDKFVLVDWEDLYNKNKIEALHINWNPTIYNFRRKIHFKTNVNFEIRKDSFYSEDFKFCRYSQVLLTIFPHSEQSESRLIIEKHRNSLNIKYKIKYYLYHFFNNRMGSKEPALKEYEILESEEELLTDIIVFDKNITYENYILIFELIPEKKEDYNKLNFDFKEVISLSMFSFAEFQIIEIPYKKIDDYKQIKTGFQKILNNKDKKNNNKISDLNIMKTFFPIYKLTINNFGYYEIRISGANKIYYGIYIYNFKNYKKEIKEKKYLKYSPFKNKKNCTISLKLEKGDYVLQIIPSHIDEQEEDDDSLKIINQKVIKDHEIIIECISYSNELLNEFEKHLFIERPENEMKFQITEIQENKLLMKQTFDLEWTKENNFGTAKAKANCFQKFMKNPGFVFFLEEETDIKVSIKLKENNIKDKPILGINILEILKNFKFKNVLEDDYKQEIEYETEEITLQPNEFGYLVVFLNVDENFIGKAVFTISSNKLVKNIRNTEKGILNFDNKITVFKKEFKKDSGGHFNNPNFLFNPFFKLNIPNNLKNERVEILAEINIDSKEKPCSLYIYNTDKNSIFDLDNKELENGFYNPAFLYEFNSIFKKLLPGNYLIIPSTLNTIEKDLEFNLDFSSNHPLSLINGDVYDFTKSFKFNITDCKEYNIKFLLLKKCKMLFTLLPKEDIIVQITLLLVKNNQVIFQKENELRDNFLHQSFDMLYEGEVFSFNVKSIKNTSYDFGLFSTDSNCFKFV